MPAIVPRSRSTVFTTDSWARQNTIADIDYMAITLSGSTDLRAIDRISTEIDTTITINDPSLLTTLMSTSIGTPTDITANSTAGYTVIAENNTTPIAGGISTDREKSYRLARIFGCVRVGKTYWRTTDKCEENSLVAFADYSKYPDKKLRSKNTLILLNDSQYTLDASMSSKSIYAFGTSNKNLLSEVGDTSDPNFEPILIRNNTSTTIGIRLTWKINASDVSRIEIR